VIVYVETNFLLELAYQQESFESCEEILRLAKTRSISLVLPEFCIAEAYLTWNRKNTERQEFHSKLQAYLQELSRSAPLRGLGEQFREVMTPLIADSEESRIRLVDAIASIENDGATIPLTAQIIYLVALHQEAYSLSSQDALVLASVKSHSELRTDPQCFVTRDRGFGKQKIRDELRSKHGECKVIFSFDDGLAHITNALARKGDE